MPAINNYTMFHTVGTPLFSFLPITFPNLGQF